jgi:hypothetical protein
MKLGDILSLRSCKDGAELFEKVQNILFKFNISAYDEDGDVKSIYDLCCEVAERWNTIQND